MSAQTGSVENQEQLRNWYIARLRKKAIQESGAFSYTPAGLINADRAAVEKLIAEKSAERVNASSRSQPLVTKKSPPTLVIGFALALLWVLQVGLVTASRPTYSLIALAVIAASGAIYVFATWSYSRVHKRLSTIAEALRDSSRSLSSDTGMGNSMVSSFSAEELLSEVLFHLAKLQEGERLIADYGSDVVCAFSKDLQLACVSPNSKRAWGYHSFQLMDAGIWDVLSEYDIQKLVQAFSASVSSMQEVEVETRFKHADSQADMYLRWCVEWSATVQLHFVVVTDITAAKRLEKLRQEFFAVISHDVRSPVANIISTLALIERGTFGELTPGGQQRIQSLQGTASYVIELLNELLDLEKIESSNFKLHTRLVQLPQLLIDSAETVRGLAENKHLNINVAAPEAEVTLDAIRIKRVLVNLLSNAIKFSAESSVIDLAAQLSAENCIISVRDYGRGISTVDQQRLFNRYYQVEAEDATLRGGAGLGLETCQAIAQAHGGSITVQSESGKGSIFMVHLPASNISKRT